MEREPYYRSSPCLVSWTIEFGFPAVHAYAPSASASEDPRHVG